MADMLDIRRQARELFAAEYSRDGIDYVADCIRNGELTSIEARAVRAIEAALAARPAQAGEVDDAAVDRYLAAQRAFIDAEDARWGRPNAGGLHKDVVREACRAGLIAARAASAASAVAPAAGYVIGDGQGTRWRRWGDTGPDWTTDRNAALCFARREDAESFARDDEDAWLIQAVGLPLAQAGVPEGWREALTEATEQFEADARKLHFSVHGRKLAVMAKRYRAMLASAPQPAVVKDCLTADAKPQVEGNGEADVDPWATLIAICDALGIDPQSARTLPGKPSEVILAAARQKYSKPGADAKAPAGGGERDECPLAGRWTVRGGYLCCGQFRVAVFDWESGVAMADNARERTQQWIARRLAGG